MKSATEKKALVLTICKLNIQNGHHLFGFQMAGLFGIKMELKKWTIWHPNNFPPFKTWLNKYSDPRCT